MSLTPNSYFPVFLHPNHLKTHSFIQLCSSRGISKPSALEKSALDNYTTNCILKKRLHIKSGRIFIKCHAEKAHAEAKRRVENPGLVTWLSCTLHTALEHPYRTLLVTEISGLSRKKKAFKICRVGSGGRFYFCTYSCHEIL